MSGVASRPEPVPDEVLSALSLWAGMRRVHGPRGPRRGVCGLVGRDYRVARRRWARARRGVRKVERACGRDGSFRFFRPRWVAGWPV